MTEVILSLGSNLGNRLEHLRRGVEELRSVVTISALSSVVEGPAREVTEGPAQGPYLNAVIRGRTTLEPEELLDVCHAVEAGEGRTRAYPNAPRTLDVDIIFFGSSVVRTPDLRIPHPRWKDRDFVLVPLEMVAGKWVDPESGRHVEEIVRERVAGRRGGSAAVAGSDEDGTLRRVAGPDALHEIS